MRADSQLVRVWHRGMLVKVHPRTRPGGRVTDPADLPDGTAAQRRSREAGLDPAMRLENIDATVAISYDHHVFDELFRSARP